MVHPIIYIFRTEKARIESKPTIHYNFFLSPIVLVRELPLYNSSERFKFLVQSYDVPISQLDEMATRHNYKYYETFCPSYIHFRLHVLITIAYDNNHKFAGLARLI